MPGAEYTGNFPCSLFNSCSGCPHELKVNDVRTGFPFNLTAPLGEGGFATVFRGEFHGGEAAFKFIPIMKEGYKYGYTSVGIWEYDQKEKINKITRFIYLDMFDNRKKRSKHTIKSQRHWLTSHLLTSLSTS